MPRLVLVVLALLAAPASRLPAQTIAERPAWRAAFDSAGVTGTVAIRRLGSDTTEVHDLARARRGFIPASTFKIPNSLVALELGVVRDEWHPFPKTWPDQEIAPWNRDHTFRTAFRYSVVPAYQLMAREVGTARYREWLARLDYGNRDAGGEVDMFWLDGDLRISALEQLDFLEKLATLALPLSERSQRIVHAMMLVEADACATLRAKTGLSGVSAREDVSQVGWYVGWVETDTDRWLFALKVDTSAPGASAVRAPLAKVMLARVGALPAGGCAR